LEEATGQWQPFLPQAPPKSFFSLQGSEFSVSFSQHELSPPFFSPSVLQQVSLPPQAKAMLVGAATKASIKATGSNMEVKNFMLGYNVSLLGFVVGGFAAVFGRRSRPKKTIYFIFILWCLVLYYLFFVLFLLR